MPDFNWLARGAALGLALTASVSGSQAQTPYYQGKTVSIIVAGTAGGGLDISARIVARHFSNFIPGHPTVVAQLMPGAGGIRAIDYLNSSAPQDGTALVILPPGPVLEPLVGARKMNYRTVDFPAIGAISKESSVCAAWHQSKFYTLDDTRKSEMIVAGTGVGSSTDLYPPVMNEVLGTKFKVITGFQGSQETALAIERGEVDGRCGWGWTSIKSTNPDWIRDKKLRILMQFGLTKGSELPDVPLAIDLAQKPEDKQSLRLLFAPLMLNKPFFTGPKTPPERIAELRAAFAAMTADQAFRDEVLKISGEDPNPTNGQDAQALMEEVYKTPEPVVARLKKILNP